MFVFMQNKVLLFIGKQRDLVPSQVEDEKIIAKT